MSENKVHVSIISLIVVGMVLAGIGIYFMNLQIESLARDVKILNTKIDTNPTPEPVVTNTVVFPKVRTGISLEQVGGKLIELEMADEQLGNHWNYELDLAKATSVTLALGNNKFTFPYHSTWGNDDFSIGAYEVIEQNTHIVFGPMVLSELAGPYRLGDLLIREKRTAETALADERYNDQSSCDGKPNPAPKKVTIGKYTAIEYQGSACEAVWVGYEVLGKNANYVFQSSPSGNDELLTWVITRSDLD